MLHQIKSHFDASSAQQKLLLIELLAHYKPDSARSLKRYHDALLFISAFPDSKRIADKTEKELLRIKALLIRFSKMDTLANSGLEFAKLSWKPSLEALHWMLAHTKDLRYTVKSKRKTEEITTLLCSLSEWDSLLDAEVSFSDWMKLLTGNQNHPPSSMLKAWLERFEKLNAAPAVRDFLFDSLSIRITCSMVGNLSLTSNKLLFSHRYFHQQKPELKQTEKLKAVYLNDKISGRILDSIKAALYARQRETDPVTYADERFLQGYETEDGFTVYLLSMKPEFRLPLESYIGYMVYSNGIPVSYGGGWILYDRCEFGINIFEQFRGGPSARILNLLMNIYKHQYGINTFIIPPYQFGEGNRDGIKSAAFWFYYKMGFRPEDKALKLLAEREWKKIQLNNAYRTPEKILLRFTKSPLLLEQYNHHWPVPDLKSLSRAAIKWTAENFRRNTRKASHDAASGLLKRAGVIQKGWSSSEKRFFRELSPFICMIPGWENWKPAELKQAVMALKEKGNNEIKFIRLLKEHGKLRSEFLKLAPG